MSVAIAALSLEGQTNFGSVNLPGKTTATVTVTIPAAATLGSIAVTTQGVTGLDFVNAGGGNCAVSTSYAANATCTVKVTFQPTLSGTRLGAAVLKDATGGTVATALVYGIGVAPQIAFSPGTEVVINPSISYPGNIAVDPNGNVYVATGSEVVKETVSGSGYTQSVVFSGYGVGGIVIDGAGRDLYCRR